MFRHLRSLCVVLLSILVCSSASALTRSWTGSSSANWSDAGNWVPAGVPQTGDDLVFPNGTPTTMTNDLPAGFAVGSLTFNEVTDIFTHVNLSGNPLTLMGDVAFPASPTNFLCYVDLKIGAPLTIGAGSINSYNGAIDVNGQALTLVSNFTTLTGALNGTGAINVPGSFGSSFLDIDGGGNYSGSISGLLNVSSSLPNMSIVGSGWLDGNATLGTVTATAASNVAPGLRPPNQPNDPHTAGVLHTKSVSLGGAYNVDLFPAATSDQLQVTGTVTLGGTLAVSMSGLATPGQSFTIIDNDGNDPVAGTFAGLPEGATITLGSIPLTISYHGGDGNDVVLTAGTSLVKSWTGVNSALWSDPGNWSPADVPAAGENLLFPNGSRFTMTNDLPAGFAAGKLTFSEVTDIFNAVRLSGNPLTLMGDLVFPGANTQFFCSLDLKIGAAVNLGAAVSSNYDGAIDVNGKTLTIQPYNTTFSGGFNGTGSILVNGGVVEIGGNGNFNGSLTGSLDLNGSIPDMNVVSFGLLTGEGTLGTVTGSAGSVLAPGSRSPGSGQDEHTVGVLHTKSVNLGGTYYVDIYPVATSDMLQVTGTVTLGGSLVVTIPSGLPAPGQSFTIIDNDGNDPVIGTFAGLPEGATISLGTVQLTISYHGGDGNDVVLTAAGSQVKSWTGANSALWSDPGNWSPVGVPATGEHLFFPNGSRTTMTNDLPAGFAFGALTFNEVNDILTNVNLSGNPLTLMGDVEFSPGSVNFICNAGLKIGAPLHIGAANVSTYNGAIDVNGQTLTLASNFTTLTGALNGTGTIDVTNSFIEIAGGGNYSGSISGLLNLSSSLPNMNVVGSGWLDGNGTLGSVTASAGATVAPGLRLANQPNDAHTVGVLHTKSVSLGGAYNVDLNLPATSDSLQVTGTVVLGGSLTVTIPGGGVTTPGQAFTIVDNDGADPVNGTFAGLTEGAILSAAPYRFRITYQGGDGNDVVLYAVGDTTTTVAQSAASTTFGDQVTLTASVASNYGPGTGSVTFLDGAAVLGTEPLQSGVASLTTSALTGGNHSISVTYSGNNTFAPSTSAPITHQVQRANATVTLTASKSSTTYGESIAFTVTVTPNAPATSVPTGNITIGADANTLGAVALVNGTATYSTATLGAGAHAVTATYAGDTNYKGGTTASPAPVNVAKAPVTLDVQSQVNPSPGGADVKLSVSIGTSSPVALSGSIVVSEGGQTLAQQAVTVNSFVVIVTGLATGDHLLLVTFSGSDNLQPGSQTIRQGVLTPVLSKTYTYAAINATELTVDVDTPVDGSGPYPAIVWVGGSTTYVPGGTSPALRETARGYVVVIPTYRAAGEAVFPAQLDDLKAAIRWIRANAVTLSIDPNHIGIWGGGAGAHLAALVGTTSDEVTQGSLQEGNASFSSRVQAVVDWAGPADLLHLQSDATTSCVPNYDAASSPQSELIGCPLQTCPSAADGASPQSFVTSDDSPFLIMHGSADCAVSPEQSLRFFNALKAAGVDATLHVIDGLGAFDATWDEDTSHSDVDAFLDGHLKEVTKKRRGARH